MAKKSSPKRGKADSVTPKQAALLDRAAASIRALPADRAALVEVIMLRLAYSIPEVAGMLGVSRSTIWRAIKDGAIKSIRIGTTERPPVRVSAEEVARLLSGEQVAK